MRYRRFGTSDLEVSEVGFGTWTLASNWWGEVEDKRGMLDAALHAGITFFDTADRKSTRLNSSHIPLSRMPSSA